MAERDENVYKAKLAEQAERYDGKFLSVHCSSHLELVILIVRRQTNIISCNTF